MELHPYDGKTREFRHTDNDPSTGLRLVARRLELGEAHRLGDIFYDLSFYSGGLGTFDKWAISGTCSLTTFRELARSLGMVTVEAAVAHESWADDFLWLIDAEESPAQEAAVEFANRDRGPQLAECLRSSALLFEERCDVNSWSLMWYEQGRLNFRSSCEG